MMNIVCLSAVSDRQRRKEIAMKWKKYTVETTTAAEDFMSSMLMDLGIEGIEIEDNVPLTKEDQADMFIDFLPELPPDDGTSHVSFYIEDDGSDQTEILKKVKVGLERLRDMVDVGTGVITSSETEDLDWINNWKKYFTSFTIEDILIKPTWEELKEEDKDKFLIEIDPGISFGTGKHETTQLCIRQLLLCLFHILLHLLRLTHKLLHIRSSAEASETALCHN